MVPSAAIAPALRHSQRIIRDPDEFRDAVSGLTLTVDFQRRQVQSSSVEQFQTPGWALDFGEANVKSCVRGVLPAGWASLCLVRGPGSSSWNGQSGEPGTLCCLPPGEELEGHTEIGFSWMTVSVPPLLWAQCRALAGLDENAFRRFAACRLSGSQFAGVERQICATRRVLREAAAGRHPDGVPEGQAASLACDLTTTAFELVMHASPPRDSLRNRGRLARRAELWIREHLVEPIRVPDVCFALGVSRRELEYAFRVIFDQSPRYYLQTLRLNMIRRALLKHGRDRDSIISIALDHGITHLGRFSAAYRDLFGERPSETLRGVQRSPVVSAFSQQDGSARRS